MEEMPIKKKLWQPKTVQYRLDVLKALEEFIAAEKASGNDYEIRMVVDVALRDYLKLPDPVDE